MNLTKKSNLEIIKEINERSKVRRAVLDIREDLTSKLDQFIEDGNMEKIYELQDILKRL